MLSVWHAQTSGTEFWFREGKGWVWKVGGVNRHSDLLIPISFCLRM
jgi:hypothetical protein